MDTRIIILLTTILIGSFGDTTHENIVGLEGDDIILPCRVDISNCGDFHTVKWYKESKRVFVFSDLANLMKPEGPLIDRSEFQFNASSSHSGLLIKAVSRNDEGLYRCEITYLEVRDNCDVVQSINLTTISFPDYVTISYEEEEGYEVENVTSIGPLSEGTAVSLICRSGGGRPLPALGWWNGTKRLGGDLSATVDQRGNEIAVSRLEVALSRDDLGAEWECRAETQLMDFSVSAHVKVDVHVRPVSVSIEGPDGPVIEGSLVNILCLIKGARPAATVRWENNTDDVVMPHQDSEYQSRVKTEEVLTDKTYETRSHLSLKVNKEDNGRVLTCEATNQVMLDKGEAPIKTSVTLQVHYAPTVHVTPDNITVNESMDFLIFCSHDSNPLTLIDVNWYKDGEKVQIPSDRYEGGTEDQPSLLVKKATRHDTGSYKCQLTNSVGTSESEDEAFVTVQYPPDVELKMEPTEAVIEAERPNITLTCEIISGEPSMLVGVRWYLDGDLLKELPECNLNDTSYVYVDEDFCDIDPSKLLLENVGRSFQGNYSCEGMTSAGWGPRSEEEELVIHYSPGKPTLLSFPPVVVKDSDLTLTCIVEDLGRPPAFQYQWLQNGHLIHDISSANWTISPVTLKNEANISCYAVNLAGPGEPDVIEIDVLAPPAFIDRLPPYQGALLNSSETSVSCRVECAPMCEIIWFKDGVLIEDDSPLYQIETRFLPPDPQSNDLDSILSILHWNMTHWPGGRLDRFHDNSNYTCTSTGNSVGQGVSSTTHFRVEYPPENITISKYHVEILEGGIPEKLRCQAKAYPEATYFWTFQNETVATGEILFLDYPMSRDRTGDYSCIAQNRHGNASVSSFINVLFKPECAITQREIESQTRLICDVTANPRDVSFTWLFQNTTLHEGVTSRGLQSVFTLDHGVSPLGTYSCYAKNDIGTSIPCEIDVTGMSGLMEKISDENTLILIAIVVAAVIMVVLVILMIFCICAKRNSSDKYAKTGKSKALEERENPDGVSALSTSSHALAQTHKWPVKPGVHVHVNGLHTLGTSNPVSGFTYGAASSSDSGSEKGSRKVQRPVASSSPLILSAKELKQEITSGRSVRKSKRNSRGSQTHLYPNSESLDADMSADSMNRTDGNSNTLSRKRKKPGSVPLGTGNGNVDVGSAEHRSFYENLPFHGMAQPPNKSEECASSSRPPSQLSSGYGSTLSNFDSRGTTSFWSLRQKAKKKDLAKFRSLRVSKPIDFAETPNEEAKSMCDLDQIIELNEAPVPAPRISTLKRQKTNAYQNIPLPVKIKAELSPEPLLPLGSDVEYADVNFSTYGPIEYKKASILAAEQRKNKYTSIPPRPPKESAF
ncbi:hemicentin-1-like isoform X3 [Artemia franciscana]|uniref:hemicentin-1-like isoform X3 n=1 Tax=Artemia franciscana TaxID=6661 RepID=UPI0032DBE70E